MGYFEFPHTRTYDSDLGWLIWAMKKLIADWEDFEESNSIQFADPITWDITRQYERLTVVLDNNGNGYISRQAVPSGIALTNTDYWTQIFSFEEVANRIRAGVAVNAGSSATTPEALTAGDLVWWDGDMYQAIVDMPAGTAFIAGTNVNRYTVDEKINSISGAAGDLVAAEAAAREAADQTLQGNIDAEAAAREAADQTLQGNIDAEAAAREAADQALQSEISELSAASYYYAVDTVADMLALSEVKADSIISTRGYYAANDGGAGRYYVTDTGTIDNYLAYGVAGKVATLIHSDGEIVVNQIGAHGDGEADDTAVINWALQHFQTTHLCADCEYKISSTLTVPYGNSFDGHGALIRTVPASEFADAGIADLPQKIAIFVRAREPINHSEFAGYMKVIKSFRLIENDCDLDITGTDNFMGMYIGYKTALSGTDYTKVNYSVYAYTFEDIFICGFRTGMHMRESWGCRYINVSIRNMLSEGIHIRGQNVNNDFIGCDVDGRNGNNAVGMELNVSPTYAQRPEGNKFTSCGFYSCQYGIRCINALSTHFSNCMLDLHYGAALTSTIGDVMVENSWLSNKTGDASYAINHATVRMESVGTASSGNKVTLANCHIENRNDNGAAQPMAVGQGQNRYADIVTDCLCSGSVRQLYGNAALRIINNSFEANDTIYTANNGVRTGNYRGATGAAMT